jgi:hypothetical protein
VIMLLVAAVILVIITQEVLKLRYLASYSFSGTWKLHRYVC